MSYLGDDTNKSLSGKYNRIEALPFIVPISFKILDRILCAKCLIDYLTPSLPLKVNTCVDFSRKKRKKKVAVWAVRAVHAFLKASP